MAEKAEERKRDKYRELSRSHLFVPVAVETSGVFGPGAHAFLSEVGCHLKGVSSEVNSRGYLFQSILVAVKCGNIANLFWKLCHLDLDLPL